LPEVFDARHFDFRLSEFFLFFVRRNVANFAPARECKSFAGFWLACGGGAKLSEFLPGVGQNPLRLGRYSSDTSRLAHRCAKFSAMGFAQLCIFAHLSRVGSQRAPAAQALLGGRSAAALRKLVAES
jgi:hypothetical protein